MQKPDWHWFSAVQVSPLPFFHTQLEASQYWPGTQPVSSAQLPGQVAAVPSHT